ncbi:MAG: UDP-N-acetylmuramate--L-alanine ligase [Candidatus Pacebacteria bacterium]|nr:UDP-N-acetylmuramate--L-alanine ligase [Candidatus Paceibacterota bacterium]
MTLPKKVHMVGIGGIGMSALAQLLVRKGVTVRGNDRDVSPTTELLESQGIAVHIGHSADVVSDDIELLVYSDAIPKDGPERTAARGKGIPEKSYFAMLGEVTKGVRTIAVAGTHGKTTTTGMLAYMLKEAGENPSAIVGSIVRDFGSNFLPGRDDLLVVEACEYKDHLLELSPDILVITNLELDHTDHFPNLEALQDTFKKAVARVPSSGFIIANPHDAAVAAVLAAAQAPIIDYTKESVPELPLIGEFNRENARAAKAAARAVCSALEDAVADRALQSFKGSWRRFEYKGKSAAGALVYDDYAHHPTAVQKTIEAARERFPGMRVVVAFHPHLYSRTRDFMDEFAKALATADEIVLAPIYPAREQPIDGVTSEKLAEKIVALGTPAHAATSFDTLYEHVTETGHLSPATLFLTMGAGDIYKVAEKLALPEVV